ncbi:MFS transporter [Leifsonia aquatica]|uniref:MFS transporter n=1 Tax=Leifsonia aquatica TaxID=144185 RepID=UPI0028B11A11|nr:MFS transporter [Leifsonia aquatica]
MFASLRIPGAARAFVPALIGRSSLAMAGLAVLLAVQSRTGSFAAAGLASAAFGIANVFAAPWRARAVDRWGQPRALGLLAVGQAAGFVALGILSAGSGAPEAWFLLLAATVGITAPPLGAAMRVVWSSLTEAGPQREKAFSLDAVAEELLFVGGPVLITAVIVATTPSIGLFTSAAAVLVGTFGLITSRASAGERGRGPAARETRVRPLTVPGFARVLVVLVGVGAVLGVVEIAAPALADEQHAPAATGWLLAAFAAGSALGGLLYGHVRWRAPLGHRLFVLCLGIGGMAVVVSLLGSLPLFAAGLVVLGAFLAPSLITGYLVADSAVPAAGRTEASTWINTAVNLGASVASALAGIVIDGAGTGAALLAAGVLAAAGASVVPVRRLRGTASADARLEG